MLMKKKIFAAVFIICSAATTKIAAHTTTDTAFVTIHVLNQFKKVISKIDGSVLKNAVVAYADQSFTQKLIRIEDQKDGSRKFYKSLESSFVITPKNLNLESCTPIYPKKLDKKGILNFSVTGYGFGKNLSNKSSYAGIYFLKAEDVKRVLNQKEYSFFIALMNKGLIREGKTSPNKETVEWTIGSKPIGHKEIFQICSDLEKVLNSTFDTLLKLGIVPSSFATTGQNGKVEYKLTKESKTLMDKDPKLKVKNIVRKPSVLILNNHGRLNFMLGWKLENSYKSGRKSIYILPMKEASYFNKSVFLKYCPEASDWIGLIF